MAKQEGLVLFPEIEAVTQKLSDEQFGSLIRAVMAYNARGESYSGEDIAVDVAFQFIANQTDRRRTANEAKSKAAKNRWSTKENKCTTMQSDADEYKNIQNVCTTMQSDAPIHIQIQSKSNPIQLNEEKKADIPPAPARQAKKPYGEFGWVKLNDDEYNRLLNDFGEAEVKRCIAYVDESAQITGNKNKWRDWNLVVRKCHNKGWGTSEQPQYTRKKEILMGCSGPGEAELEALRRIAEEV